MSSRIVKAKLGEDLRRVTVQAGTDIAQLRSTLSLLFSVPSSSHTLKLRYADEEGDLITLSSDIELQEALSALPPGAILKLDLELVPFSSSSFSSSSSSTPLSPLPPFSPSSSFLSSPTIPLPSSVASSLHPEEQPPQPEEEEEREKEQEQEQQEEMPEQEEEVPEQEKGKQPAVEENGEELPPYQTEEEEGKEEEGKEEKKKEKEREREREDRGVDLDFLLNEFHYHRLIFQTACKAAFESLSHEYEEHHKAKIQEMWSTAKLQSSLLANTIEETFDEWKREVRTSPSAQEFSTRVSEALKGVETFTAPVIESIRVALLNLFSSKPPSSLTSSQVVREMETFHFTSSPHPSEEPASSSPVPADDVKVIPSDVHTHEESVTGHVGEVPLASALSGEFIYVLPEEENSFSFQDAVAEIVSMGFTDLVAIQAALQAHNGDVNGAVNSLL